MNTNTKIIITKTENEYIKEKNTTIYNNDLQFFYENDCGGDDLVKLSNRYKKFMKYILKNVNNNLK